MEETIVFRFFALILSVYIVFSITAICNLYKLRKIKQEASQRITPSNSDLWFYLLGTQKELKMPKRYWLEATDRAVVVKFIEDYKNKLSIAYFQDRFHPTKTKREQTDIVLFMLSFYDYFDRTEMHDIIDRKVKESELIYYKAYYITYLYCRNCTISNPSHLSNWKDYVEKYLISELDKRIS